jgi:hypothetical protein
MILFARTRGIAQGGHGSLLVGLGTAASSRTVMRWPGAARAASDLGLVSSPRCEEEGRVGWTARWRDWLMAVLREKGRKGGASQAGLGRGYGFSPNLIRK